VATPPSADPPGSGPAPAPDPAPAPPGVRLLRFDAVQRAVHWVNALLFAVLIATGAALYVPALSGVVARRPLMARIHVDAGLLLPVPLVLALIGPWGAALRRDFRRFNRWTGEDRRWLRLALHRELTSGVRNGKFNAGQKLNAAFTGGAIVVMLATGVVMRWGNPWPLSWRTGSTFVHQVLAISAWPWPTGRRCGPW
jgi:formate dehydrogenase subunit gamma